MPRKARRRNLEIFGARIIFFARLQPGIGHNRQGVRAEIWPGKSMLARRWLKKARGGRHDDAPTAASEASPLGPLPYLKRAPLRTFEHTGNPARPRRTGELPHPTPTAENEVKVRSRAVPGRHEGGTRDPRRDHVRIPKEIVLILGSAVAEFVADHERVPEKNRACKGCSKVRSGARFMYGMGPNGKPMGW